MWCGADAVMPYLAGVLGLVARSGSKTPVMVVAAIAAVAAVALLCLLLSGGVDGAGLAVAFIVLSLAASAYLIFVCINS